MISTLDDLNSCSVVNLTDRAVAMRKSVLFHTVSDGLRLIPFRYEILFRQGARPFCHGTL